MKTIFEYTNISKSDRLESFVQEKLNDLSTKYSFVIRGDIFFKKENKTDGTGHICGIRLSAPGPRLYASSDELNFEDAISKTISDLKDQLERRKEKMKTY
ncbi:30S ribosomal protein S30 [Aquimarina sp. AD1]|uniref:HPF/RaiA family ribosome-associated protein n=1 Tax=Aquimarina TaxID=290174 RepID=UPI0004050F38|nr:MULTISPECIES: HPF/RaiA family ribosome-associated protein [Aquimarina]AXT57153.1 30S ribosomal protein S30 [Aquimarina sp. AD1]RKN37160.1 30S ribosomal protein S30 [Aquimarina sp. AD1]